MRRNLALQAVAVLENVDHGRNCRRPDIHEGVVCGTLEEVVPLSAAHVAARQHVYSSCQHRYGLENPEFASNLGLVSPNEIGDVIGSLVVLVKDGRQTLGQVLFYVGVFLPAIKQILGCSVGSVLNLKCGECGIQCGQFLGSGGRWSNNCPEQAWQNTQASGSPIHRSPSVADMCRKCS